mgnify:CR=1 FL=1
MANYDIKQKCFIEEEDCCCFECLKVADELARYFDYRHLPDNLKQVSKKFYNLMAFVLMNISDSGQRHQSINNLLAAKDCAVRASLR